MYKVKHLLEQKNYKIIDADVHYFPRTTVSLNEENSKLIEKLYEKLDAIEGVAKISTNVE